MGQKVHPVGFRLALTRDWRSRWFSGKRHFGALLNEDLMIRGYVKRNLVNAAVTSVTIERYANRVRVGIRTARPGLVVGRKGQDLERMRSELGKRTNKDIYIEIHEIRDADANAQLVAENIAAQVERRVALRRALKRAQRIAMDMGVDGIKIRCCGRLNGAELSRVDWNKEGRTPLHTLRANIDYGFAEAHTTAGLIGVKVWICKKDDYQPARTPGRGRRSHAADA